MPGESIKLLRARDFKGSRLRCLIASSLGREALAEWLTRLVEPHAHVAVGQPVVPRGFLDPSEARLGERRDLLAAPLCQELTRWWLDVPARANTPNWDIVSACQVNGQAGLLLVEAKAHQGELHEGKPQGHERNDARIRQALREASDGLGGEGLGWRLSAESHYQLSNRFAWAWKVASLGVPVVLVYLGFLGAHEIPKPLLTPDDWRDSLIRHSRQVVPPDVWERTLPAGAASVTPLIRSARIVASVET